jgi:hypothetical protein
MGFNVNLLHPTKAIKYVQLRAVESVHKSSDSDSTLLDF